MSDSAADDEQETDELPGMENMGVEATVRMQKAQLTVLREELEQMVAAQQDGEEKLATMQAKFDNVQRQQKEGARALAQKEVALEKQRELCKETCRFVNFVEEFLGWKVEGTSTFQGEV